MHVHHVVVLAPPDRLRVVAREQVDVRHPPEESRHVAAAGGEALVARRDLEPPGEALAVDLLGAGAHALGCGAAEVDVLVPVRDA